MLLVLCKARAEREPETVLKLVRTRLRTQDCAQLKPASRRLGERIGVRLRICIQDTRAVYGTFRTMQRFALTIDRGQRDTALGSTNAASKMPGDLHSHLRSGRSHGGALVLKREVDRLKLPGSATHGHRLDRFDYPTLVIGQRDLSHVLRAEPTDLLPRRKRRHPTIMLLDQRRKRFTNNTLRAPNPKMLKLCTRRQTSHERSR